jgi:hypothetical protein
MLLSAYGCSLLLAQTEPLHSARLLLTPQRLRRLQRDRERQTVRWLDFEKRVQSVPDSRERGFELALYYAVTHDPERGQAAVQWAAAHRCERRQVALILDWAADLISDSSKQIWLNTKCPAGDDPEGWRDALFLQIATGEDPDALVDKTAKSLLDELQKNDWHDGRKLYTALEYLYAVRSAERSDLREEAPQFFSSLPSVLLLSLQPGQVDHPDWHLHIASLALIDLDPNLNSSQYLQGWAIEDRQMVREGEGVAYEFLWGDPYLPGVGYENLDPWSYDSSGELFARTDWEHDACWIHVSAAGVDHENCPPAWQQKPMAFGRLTLIPVRNSCVQVPKRRSDETVIIWKFQPRQTIYYTLNDNGQAPVVADAAGMWKAPANAEGKVCDKRTGRDAPVVRVQAKP